MTSNAGTGSTEISLELGVDTFGDVTVDLDGRRRHEAQVIRHVVEEGVLADRVGLDFIGIGEHHRPDFAVSSPETVLAAIRDKARGKEIDIPEAEPDAESDDLAATLEASLPKRKRARTKAAA